MHSSYFILRCSFFVALFSGIQATSNAQETYQAAKVIPPSPTAASLGKYGEFPVSYYSGTANISIPLYEIKTSNHTLPITLQYTSTGIKVGESASWVGLGWSLAAGGVITRTTIGLDDFGNNGYYRAAALPPSEGSSYYPNPDWVNDKQFFDNMYNGTMDGEPDLFHYNFAGYTGKFALGKLADGAAVFMDERNNMKVEYVPATISWVITDGNGYRYYFNTKERATDYVYSSTSSQISNNATLADFRRVIQADITTSWYLDSIVAPSSEAIKFIYAFKSKSITPISKSEKVFNLLELLGSCANTPNGTYKYYNASRQVIYDVYLEQIIFTNGTIDFNTADRDDVEYTDVNKPQRLSEIVIKGRGGNIVKKFLFDHDYFTPYKRLKLNSVVEYGSDGTAKPPYTFTYFEPDNIPPVYSNSIDHWGYYNGGFNSELVPEVTVAEYQRYFEGADRSPDTSVANLKRGVLASITYPTGGTTNFDYELNEYSNLKGDDKYTTAGDSRHTYAYDGDSWTHSEASFDIVAPDTPRVTFRFNYEKIDPNAPDLINPNLEVIYAYVSKAGQGRVLSFTNFYSPNSDDPSEDVAYEVLQPGHYTLTSRYIQGYLTTLTASWEYRVPVTQKKGGGLRIKTIINYENGKQTNVRKFLYTVVGDSSSGRLITKPVHTYTLDYDARTDGSGGTSYGCPYHVTYLGRESSSVYPMGLSSSGPVVAYDKVTELFGENGEFGRTEYYYHNREDGIPTTPFMPVYHDPRNGKLDTSIVYNAEGIPLKKTKQVYLAKEVYGLKGVKLYRIDQVATPNPVSSVTELQYKIKYYDLPSRWYPLQSETTIEYGGSNELITAKTYDYQNFDNKEVTLMEVTRSNGKKLTTKYKYPGDYTTAGASSFVNQMKQQHIISPVVEELTFITDGGVKKLLTGSFTEYKPYNNGLYRPGVVSKINTNVPLSDVTESTISPDNQIHLHPNYKPEVYFDKYNALGNLEQYHKFDNVPYSYIWDYKGDLPIAQVSNATAADIAYTSFEADGTGSWVVNSSARDVATAITGNQSFNLSNAGTAGITKAGLTTSREYTVSYWTRNAVAFTITGTQGQPVKGRTVNGWTYYQHKVTGQSTIKLSGSGYIDELRLYPATAQMETYTYSPLVGISSQCDTKNQISYYEYDDLNRLKLIKDQNGKILKQYDYQYQKPITQ